MDPVTGLSLGRIAVGVVSIARPEILDRALAPSGGSAVVTRMFGTREIAIGAVTLVSRGKVRGRLVRTGIAIDLADAAAAYVSIQDGSTDKKAGGALAVTAAGAALAGIASLLGDSKVRRTEKKLAKAEAKLAKRSAKAKAA